MDWLPEILSFILGASTGLLWPRKTSIVIQEVVRELLVPAPAAPRPPCAVSPGRTRVIFRFANGTEQHKTLFNHSLDPTLPWTGKLFAREPEIVPGTISPGEGPIAIYNEVVTHGR